MENITLNWYFGNDRSMLVSNCLFRMGGAAILLSNKRSDRRRSKYQLVHPVCTNKGADDKSCSCVTRKRIPLVELEFLRSKELMAVAGDAQDQHHHLGALMLFQCGRAVLDELEKNLQLSDWHMEPSRMTLYRLGNTSSSSLWYELAYTETKGRIKKGDRTWQIAFGPSSSVIVQSGRL
ncbi:hypothetical protein NE237_001575 [Protea cynaroides]|uniref:very-long-chain 3-oxoacyl-CoA synthase n=1 Tax=Protea cynaroides TaxID=273540 RepID=A0A9Q0QYK2_9MAGN|nr:hypothetical protein NE237_001575 [Protea cynaroides]